MAALFAIITKVGAYAILRMYTLVFGPEAEITAGLAGDWLLPAALLTLAVGAIGVLGAREIGRLVAFGAITFNSDTNKLVVRPIERMISKMEKIREDLCSNWRSP